MCIPEMHSIGKDIIRSIKLLQNSSKKLETLELCTAC